MDYLEVLREGDMETIRMHLLKALSFRQEKRIDPVSDGDSLKLTFSNIIKRSPFSSLSYSLYGVLFLFYAIALFAMVASRIPEGEFIRPTIAVSLTLIMAQSICSDLDSVIRSKIIPNYVHFVIALLYILALIGGFAVLIGGLYLWSFCVIITIPVAITISGRLMRNWIQKKWSTP
jgi:hypothetical protein